MTTKLLSILNALSVALVIFINYLSVAVSINGNDVGSLSAEYDNLFTPAGYAFSIWGIIFLGLVAYSVNEILETFKSKDQFEFTRKAGPWFYIANLMNVLWVIIWLYEITWLSVIIMLVLLFSLVKIILNTDMERWDAPLGHIALRWWPICIYSGWIAVATIANVSAYLAKLGWDGAIMSEAAWASTMIIVAAMLNLFMIITRNMREFALVGVWALTAIYVRQAEPTVALVALISAVILAIAISVHAILNIGSNPFFKMLKP